MKAMVLTAPHELGIDEVERAKPGHNEVLVRITNSGICGTDLKIYKGAIPVRHPLIMGHEMIGEVVEGGDENLRRGQRVIVDPAIFFGIWFNFRAGPATPCPSAPLIRRATGARL